MHSSLVTWIPRIPWICPRIGSVIRLGTHEVPWFAGHFGLWLGTSVWDKKGSWRTLPGRVIVFVGTSSATKGPKNHSAKEPWRPVGRRWSRIACVQKLVESRSPFDYLTATFNGHYVFGNYYVYWVLPLAYLLSFFGPSILESSALEILNHSGLDGWFWGIRYSIVCPFYWTNKHCTYPNQKLNW